MKKLLLILAIGAFVACNDAGTDDATGDTTIVTPSTADTTTIMPVPADTMSRPMDTTARPMDTTATK